MDIVATYLHKELQKLAELLIAAGQTDQEALESMRYGVTVALQAIQHAPKT